MKKKKLKTRNTASMLLKPISKLQKMLQTLAVKYFESVSKYCSKTLISSMYQISHLCIVLHIARCNSKIQNYMIFQRKFKKIISRDPNLIRFYAFPKGAFTYTVFKNLTHILRKFNEILLRLSATDIILNLVNLDITSFSYWMPVQQQQRQHFC